MKFKVSKHFAKFGWLSRPISILGWLIVALAVWLNVKAFISVDRNSHSVSDTLIGFLPYLIALFLIWAWTAKYARK